MKTRIAPEMQEDAAVELVVSKTLVKVGSTVIIIMLGLLTYFIQDWAQSIKDLTTSINSFNTYMQTNDINVGQLKKQADGNTNINAAQAESINAIDKRVTIIETELAHTRKR